MKKCFKCGVVKPLGDFYTHPKMKDGHLNKCKVCTQSDTREHYAQTRESQAQYERLRYYHPGRRQQISESQRKQRKNNPDKDKARVAVHRAILAGKIVKLPCEVCGEINSQAHHTDYTKPLDVKWLCRKHHLAEHGKESFQFSTIHNLENISL